MSKHKGIDEKRKRAIGERIAMAKDQSPKYREMSQTDFGKVLGIKGQAVSLWLRGERLPGVENCIELSELLNISLDWLLTGRGGMRLEKVQGTTYAIEKWPAAAKEVLRGMAAMYDEAPAKGKLH